MCEGSPAFWAEALIRELVNRIMTARAQQATVRVEPGTHIGIDAKSANDYARGDQHQKRQCRGGGGRIVDAKNCRECDANERGDDDRRRELERDLRKGSCPLRAAAALRLKGLGHA